MHCVEAIDLLAVRTGVETELRFEGLARERGQLHELLVEEGDVRLQLVRRRAHQDPRGEEHLPHLHQLQGERLQEDK